MHRYDGARGGLMMKDSSLITVERIEKTIFLIRGEKVMLDSDLASLYGVETKAANRAAKRNLKRFPADFMFQLTAEESAALRYQIGASTKVAEGDAIYPMPSPSKVSRCFQVSLAANGL